MIELEKTSVCPDGCGMVVWVSTRNCIVVDEIERMGFQRNCLNQRNHKSKKPFKSEEP